MNGTYQSALKELTKLFENENIRHYHSMFNENNNKVHPSIFNIVPVNSNLYISNNENLSEDLQDLVSLIRLLLILDDKFLNLVEQYQDSFKTEHTYKLIEEELLKTIEVEDSNTASDNARLILDNAIKDLFSNKYQRSNLPNMFFYFYNKLYAYISTYYSDLLDFLADYYVKKLCRNININQTAKNYINENKTIHSDIRSYLDTKKEFIFLSYAFRDKFLSFLLYLEALSEGKILFVDWMYSVEMSNTQSELKNNLSYYLHNAEKLLFLQSINSELNISPRMYGNFSKKQKTVRQWCSWEIGHFYKMSNCYCTNCICKSNPHTYKFEAYKHLDLFNNIKSTNNINLLLEDIASVSSMQAL